MEGAVALLSMEENFCLVSWHGFSRATFGELLRGEADVSTPANGQQNNPGLQPRKAATSSRKSKIVTASSLF